MAIAQLDWSLVVECPGCKKDIDLASGDYDSNSDCRISGSIFNNKWDDLRGLEITCEKCKHNFELESVEY
jgi:hypothetical protein